MLEAAVKIKHFSPFCFCYIVDKEKNLKNENPGRSLLGIVLQAQ